MQTESLLNWVNRAEGNGELARALIQRFYHGQPPIIMHTASFFPHAYREASQKVQAQSAFTMRAINYCIEELPMNRRQLYSCYYYGVKSDDDFNAMYLVKRALRYSLFLGGNCGDRACYAGIFLAEVCKGTSIDVSVLSYPERDHYVCVLSDKTSKREWVFDPLTNAKELFERKDYEREVLVKFPMEDEPKKAFHYHVNSSAGLPARLVKLREEYRADEQQLIDMVRQLGENPDFREALDQEPFTKPYSNFWRFPNDFQARVNGATKYLSSHSGYVAVDPLLETVRASSHESGAGLSQ